MRLPLIFLFAFFLAADFNNAWPANMLFKEDFEDGTISAPLSVDSTWGWGAVKIVSTADGANVFAGQKCLRGNFSENVTDSITGLKATTRYSGVGVDINGRSQFYVCVQYRLDPGNQWIMDDGSNTGLGYKFFYLMGTPWNNTLNWVLAQLWGPDHWDLVDNQPNNNTGYSAQVYVSSAHARLGVWHTIELYFKLNSAPGAKDGKFLFRLDSTTHIDKADVPWQTSSAQTFGTLGGVPDMYGGCCTAKYSFGWQIDNLELWDSLPPLAGAGVKAAAASGRPAHGRLLWNGSAVRYLVLRPCRVTLDMRDCRGRLAGCLVNGMKAAGSYEVPLKSFRAVACGVYLVALREDNRLIDERVIFLP